MFYKLKHQFMLRGWKLLPTGVINRFNRKFTFLKPNQYRTLKKCNGMIDAANPLFTDSDRENLEFLFSNGLIDKNESASPLAPEQIYRSYENRFIYQVHWLLTGNCNARCKHCYMSAPQALYGEFSTETCMDIVRQMSECGVQSVILSGGEPLIRKDFWNIIDSLISHKIHIDTIMSNGLLVNENFLDKLDSRGIKPGFIMSFDGIDGWPDWLRGIKGAEKSVIHAFEICNKRGFETSAEYCLHHGNLHVLHESVKLLGKLGVRSLKVNPLEKIGNGYLIDEYALSCEEVYEEFLRYIPEYIEDDAPIKIMLGGFFVANDSKNYRIGFSRMPEDKLNDRHCLCGHARNVMHIAADGRILPCIPFTDATNLHKFFYKDRRDSTQRCFGGFVLSKNYN